MPDFVHTVDKARDVPGVKYLVKHVVELHSLHPGDHGYYFVGTFPDEAAAVDYITAAGSVIVETEEVEDA